MPVRFKVDTGSQANIIPVSIYRKLKEPKAPLHTSNQPQRSREITRNCKLFGKVPAKPVHRHRPNQRIVKKGY